MSIETPERTGYTPWWWFALAVVGALTALGLFVNSASQAPVNRGRSAAEVAGQGAVVQDGKLAFTLDGVQRKVAEIGDPYFGTSPNMGTYTLVTLSVRNVSNESVVFDGSYVIGVDANGSHLRSDREAQYYANEDGSGMLTAIAPGQQIRTSVAFDVPGPEKLVAVEVHDSVFSRGATIAFA